MHPKEHVFVNIVPISENFHIETSAASTWSSADKSKCTALFTVQEVLDALVEFDELEEDYNYPSSSSFDRRT